MGHSSVSAVRTSVEIQEGNPEGRLGLGLGAGEGGEGGNFHFQGQAVLFVWAHFSCQKADVLTT